MAAFNLPLKTSSSTNISPTIPRSGDSTDLILRGPDGSKLPVHYYIIIAISVATAILLMLCIFCKRQIQKHNQRAFAIEVFRRAAARNEHGPSQNLPNEDGLNELGEVPPPYQPEALNEEVPSVDGPNEGGEVLPPAYQRKSEETEDDATIALRTLEMDGTVHRDTAGGYEGEGQSLPRYTAI
ncbi:hypothetical protein G6011_11808 [Alternaria panax]|uniref:Uncharacterized protein n=1 Tax=Alternaria panax TaxID=48097 RepID=A0AAD4I415_9PLEO|nr:hypothetical protein G6011_11808 [Alternaria panax]